MTRPLDASVQSGALPTFERLEDRLLLTTIRGGEFFIYHNSQGETVRISLVGEPEDMIEVFADHAHFGVVDLPGFLNGNPDPESAIGWPVPWEFPTRRVWNANRTQSWYVWNNQAEQYIDEQGAQQTIRFGSEAEIYGIYVVSATENTRLTISKLIVDPVSPFNDPGWSTNIDPYSGFALRLEGVGPYIYSDIMPSVTAAVDNSGTVLVGARHAPLDPAQLQIRWVGVYGEDPFFGDDSLEVSVGHQGVYPGTPPYAGLPAGITISSDAFRMSSPDPLGRDVGAVAADKNGSVFAVDSSPFIGNIVNTDFYRGNLGNDLRALGIDQFGQSYVVDHERQITPIVTGMLNAVDPQPVGTNMRALAAINGFWYGVDEDTGEFRRLWNDTRRPPPPRGVESLGLVVDRDDPGQSFTNFVSLDTAQGANGDLNDLIGLATFTGDGQLYIVRLSNVSALRPASTVRFSRVAALVIPEENSPWPDIPPLGAMSVRYDADGSKMEYWAVTSGNQLVNIDPASGLITLAGGARTMVEQLNLGDFELLDADLPTGSNSIGRIVGLEFIGQTLYGITEDEHLYRIDLRDLETTSVICTDMGETSAPLAESLAFDPAQPGRLFTIMDHQTLQRLGSITLETTLVRVSGNGMGTVLAPAWDNTENDGILGGLDDAMRQTFVFGNFTGLDFATYDPLGPAGVTEYLYGVAEIIDLDPAGLPDAPTGPWLLQIDVVTGGVTRLARIVGPMDFSQVSSVAYNELEGVFYAVDPDNNELYTLDPTLIDDRGDTSSLNDVLDLSGRTDTAAGTNPTSVAHGDVMVDGGGPPDGIPDAIVASHDTDEVLILPGLGDGTFGAPQALALDAGSGPVHVLLVQLNDDNTDGVIDANDAPDIVVVNQTAQDVSIFLADVNAGGFALGTFSRVLPDVAGGTIPVGAAVGDVDGDGTPDLVVASQGSPTVQGDEMARVYIGNGNGTFAAAVPATRLLAGEPTDILLADADGDGNLDIITSNRTDNVGVVDLFDNAGVLLGNGDGTFMEYTELGPEAVAAGHLNGDGRMDIVIANGDGNNISVLMNAGNGVFTGRRTYPVGKLPVDVALADFNGDGFLDAIVVNQGDPGNPWSVPPVAGIRGTIMMLPGDGTGEFGAPVTLYTAPDVQASPRGLTIGNVDLDGNVDIVFANFSRDQVVVLRGNGVGGTIGAPAVYPVGDAPQDVVLADMDRDTLLDIVVLNRSDQTVTILLNNGVDVDTGLPVGPGLFPNDGAIPDENTFLVVPEGAGDQRPVALAVTDFDGDRINDIATANQLGDSVSVLLGNGDGSLAGAVQYYAGNSPSGLFVANLTKTTLTDDNPEIIVTNQANDTVSVLIGNGDGSFTEPTVGTIFATGQEPTGVVIANVIGTNSNDPDVITVNRDDDTVSIRAHTGGLDLFGVGTNHTLRNWFATGGRFPTAVAAGDLDADGNLDLVVAHEGDPPDDPADPYLQGTVRILWGQGDGTYETTATSLYVGVQPVDVVVVDRNGDGRLDILTADSGSHEVTAWLRSSAGAREFVKAGPYPVGLAPLDLTVVDADGDGSLDVFTANSDGDSITWFPGSGQSAGRLPMAGNADPFVGIEWVLEPTSGKQALFGVTASAGMLLPAFGLPESDLYVISPLTGQATLLDDVIRNNPEQAPHDASLTSLSYSPLQPGYLWSTDRVINYYNSDGVRIDDWRVFFDQDGDPHMDRINGPALVEWNEGYRLTKIPLSSALMASNGQGAIATQTILMDAETGNHPFWYYDSVYAMDFDANGLLYAVGKLRTLEPDVDPLVSGGAEETWLITIDDNFHIIPTVSVVSRVAEYTATVPEISTISFGGDGTLYGFDSTNNQLFHFNFPYDGTVTLERGGQVFGDGLVGMDFQPDYVSSLAGYGDGTFGEREEYATGNGPYLAPLADVNRDGYLDLITADEFDGTFSVTLTQIDPFFGTVTFLPPVSYPVGNAPVAIGVGEFNRDGNLDLAIVNRDDNQIVIVQGYGFGTFQTAAAPGQVATAQLNDDNRDGAIFWQDTVLNDADWLDLITVNPDNDTVSVMMGVGNGSYPDNPVFYAVGQRPVGLAVGQLNDDNGDGTIDQGDWMDIVTANEGDATISVLLGRGNGTFSPATSYTVNQAPQRVLIGDVGGVNGAATDSIADVIVVEADGSSTVFINDGQGALTAVIARPYTGAAPRDAVLADLNGDGRLDLVVTNAAWTVQSLLGNGNGTFQAAEQAFVGYDPRDVAVMQLNDDNQDGVLNSADIPDLVTADYDYWNYQISILIGAGDGTFTAHPGQPSIYLGDPSGPTSIATGQLNDDNGDGLVNASDWMDLVVTNVDSDTAMVLLGRGLNAPDVDNDNIPDSAFLIGATYDVSLLNPNPEPVSVALADVDGDGLLDMVVSNQIEGFMAVRLGNGDGTFGALNSYQVGTAGDVKDVGIAPVDIAVGDLNRDRVLDLVVVNSQDNPAGLDTVSVLIGNAGANGVPDGTFQDQVKYTVGENPSSIALVDLNFDGVPDIVVTNADNDTVSVLLANGDGTFQAQRTFGVGDYPMDVAIGDMDGDAWPDLVVANYGHLTSGGRSVSYLRGRGDGTFSPQEVFTVSNRPNSVALGDFDEDGDLDIVAGTVDPANNASVASVLLGTGDGLFLGMQDYPLANGARTVRVGDLNADGHLDIAASNFDDRFFGASKSQLYTINLNVANPQPLTAIGGLGLSGNVTGLSANPLDSTFHWGVDRYGRGPIQSNYLIKIFTSHENAIQDMGRIRVGGTVAGRLTNAGDVELIDMGFLWARVEIGGNLDTFIARQGGSGRGNFTPSTPFDDGTLISEPILKVGGTLNRVETLANPFYASVGVDNHDEIFAPGRTVNELEMDVSVSFNGMWINGEMPDLVGSPQGWNNDTMDRAQFINHPTGSMDLYGYLGHLDAPAPEDVGPLPEDVPGFPAQDWEIDWFALPMQAGQTVSMQGWFEMLGVWYPFIAMGTSIGGPKAHLYDSDGRWVASNGYETWDDYGVGSRYRWDTPDLIDEQKPLLFTAPAAGTYYLAIITPPDIILWHYWIDIEGAAPCVFGGAQIGGDWLGGRHMFVSLNDLPTYWDDGGAPVSNPLLPDDIAVENGGNLGGLVVAGALGTPIAPMVIHTIGGGDMYAVDGGSVVGFASSEGSIGRLGSTSGGLSIVGVAGYVGYLQPGPYNWDAYIQNVFAAGGAGGSLSATGSMGSMHIGGDMLMGSVVINSDNVGPAATADLIQIDGDWGNPLFAPVLSRPDDSNFGYVHVGGDTYETAGNVSGRVISQRKSDGSTSNIWDDSGGMLTITPLAGDSGTPTPYSYKIIGVDDPWHTTSGDGGVIVDLTLEGPAMLSVTGDIKIGNLSLRTGTTATVVGRNLTVSGVGGFNVYYVTADGDFNNYANPTGGDIISGTFQAVNSILTGGSIGAQIGKLGTWVHGLDTAPVSANLLTEPQYGWYRDRINGLSINGDAGPITAGGFIRDIRSTGRLGPIVVNSDRITPGGQWHGVNGIIWSDQRIDSINVGDGLADDGPVAKAQAAIMCSQSIGRVTISGPRYVNANGVVFGEINGSILGVLNEWVPVAVVTPTTPGASGASTLTPDPAWIINWQAQQGVTPPPQFNELLAVGEVVGTEGAQLTAIVGGLGLESFYCFTTSMAFNPIDDTDLTDDETVIYSGVGSVRFTGDHAEINGAEIAANYVNEVVVGAGSDGMFDTYITGQAAKVNGYAVGRVAAGGPGMKHVSVDANGGDMGTIEGLDAVSDIEYSSFAVTDGGIRTIRTRDILESQLHAVDDIGTITVARDMLDLVQVGGGSSVLVVPGISPLMAVQPGDDERFNSLMSDSYAVGAGTRALQVGDLNNDGWDDIVTANEYNDDHYVTVLLADGFGGFIYPPEYYVAEGGPRSMVLADLNNDGNLDIITANYKDGTVSTLFGDGTGAFGIKRVYLVGERPAALAVGDVNGDRILDIVTANELSDDVSVLIGRGNGTFLDEFRLEAGGGPSSVAIGQLNDDDGDLDIDNDDYMDLVVANRLDDNVTVILGERDAVGRTRFQYLLDSQTYDVGKFPMHILLVDLDLDGKLDLISANNNDRQIALMMGDGAGAFTPHATQPRLDVGYNPRWVTVGQINDDNGDNVVDSTDFLDLVVANQTDDSVSILLGQDGGTFDDAFTQEVEPNVVSVLLTDLNRDGELDLLTANWGPSLPGLLAGAVGKITVGHNVVDSYMKINGPLGSMTVGNAYTNSTMLLPGKSANLKLLDVKGDISGFITSHGQIGTIVSRTGGIWADVATKLDPGAPAPSNDVGKISTDDGFFGKLRVDGSLGMLECFTSLGRDPRDLISGEIPQHFVIAKDLGTLRVVSKRGAPAANLYADISVGGNLTKIDVDGTLFSDIVVHGDLVRMQLDGNLGFQAADGTRYGSLDVLGQIKQLSFARMGDVVADIISGGSIKKMAFRDGDLLGNIISRYGDIEGISLVNGDIKGKISGRSIRDITVKDGDITGDLRATNGGIRSVKVTNGDLLANVSACNGMVDLIQVTNGDFGSAAAKVVASATRGFKKIDVRGDMYADVETEGVIDVLSIRGNRNVPGNLTHSMVSADAGIKKVDIFGDMDGSTLRTGAKIDRLNVRGDVTNGSRVSAGWDIGKVDIRGNLDNNAALRAGWDVGHELAGILLSEVGAGGAQQFSESSLASVGDGPVQAVLADLNGNGIDDLIVVNRDSDDVTVRLNHLDGTFGPQVRYHVGDGPVAAAVGDINGDGKADIVVVNSLDDTVSFLLGNGDGTFYQDDDPATPALDDDPATPEVPFMALIGTGPTSIALGQITDDNADGSVDDEDDLDILIGNAGDNSITLLRSSGQGAFAQIHLPGLADAPVAVGLVDLDPDPDPAIDGGDEMIVLLGGATNSVGVLMNDAGPAWSIGLGLFVWHGVGADPVGMAFGDMNNDDDMDIVVANRGDSTVGVLTGDGTGNLNPHAPYATGTTPEGLAVGFVNDDAALDVVTVNSGSNDISVLFGDATGTLPAPASTATWATPQAIALGMVNSDLLGDVVVIHDTVWDNPMNGGEAHSGSIASLTVRGNFDGAVVSAGIDADDGSSAPGYSIIKKVNIRPENIVDSAGTAILADSEIDSRFVEKTLDPIVWANLQYTQTADLFPAVSGGPYTIDHFGPTIGPRSVDRQWTQGDLTIKLTGGSEGLAYYDNATHTLTLIRTIAQSTITIQWKGAGPYGTIHVQGIGPDGLFDTPDDGPATDDSALANIRVIGDVTIGNVDVDGPVKTMTIDSVNDPAVWNLPGGVNNVTIKQDVDNLTAVLGGVNNWNMKGGYDGGSFTADEVRTFQTRGDVTADVGTGKGEMRTFRVGGDYSGTSDIYGNVATFDVRGSFTGAAVIHSGDLRTMNVFQEFSGSLDVRLGELRTLTIRNGDFGGAAGTIVQAAMGIQTFRVSKGAFSGVVNTDGDLRTLDARRGLMTGRVRVAGSIQRASFGAMRTAIVSAGNDFLYADVYGDMEASSIFAGLDLGYDPYGEASQNIQLDGITPVLWRTAANADTARGGEIKVVTIRGDMSPRYDATIKTWALNSRGCIIAAAVNPGKDSYAGTYDDKVHGVGRIGKVVVYGGIFGNGNYHQLWGVVAASEAPTVYHRRNRVFAVDTTQHRDQTDLMVDVVPPSVGPLVVEAVSPQANSVIVRFSHPVNTGTLNTRQRDPNDPTTFLVYSSPTPFRDLDGDGLYDHDGLNNPLANLNSLTDTRANQILWDPNQYLATMQFSGNGTWANIPGAGPYFLLVLDGDRITDPRGGKLDGDADGTPGGQFQFMFLRV